MVVVDASPSNSKSSNMVHDIEWDFNVHCNYNPSVHDACMSVVQILKGGTLTVVPQSTLLHNVTFLVFLSLPLQGI